jgi:G3E family GTPase
MSAPDQTLPLTVITGFLGSGKTTLIAGLLRRPELSRTAVIINEFGEIGLDHELIEQSEEDLVELSTGCLCCVMRGDLVDTIHRLMGRRAEGKADFERIILETTGLADPAPILHACMADPALNQLIALDRVVVTVDSINGVSTLDQHQESRRQAALADLLLLTKTDLVEAEPNALSERLGRLNPHAEIQRTTATGIDPALLFGNGSDAARDLPPMDADHDHHHHHDDINSVSLRLERPLRAVTLTLLLQALAETLGSDLLRLKGIIEIAESPETPAVVHGVQHVFHPMRWLDAWPSSDHQSRLVLIGRRLDATWISALLAEIEAEVEEATRQ